MPLSDKARADLIKAGFTDDELDDPNFFGPEVPVMTTNEFLQKLAGGKKQLENVRGLIKEPTHDGKPIEKPN